MTAWLPVPGWEGWYSVSDGGAVRAEQRTIQRSTGHLFTRQARVLRPTTHGRSGHQRVRLSRQSTSRDVFVHTLVLEAFVGPAPAGHQACHGDGNPANNSLSNLRWDTASANSLDAVRHGVHPQARKTHCPSGHPYSEENTCMKASTGRRCRVCERRQSAAYRRAMDAAQ